MSDPRDVAIGDPITAANFRTVAQHAMREIVVGDGIVTEDYVVVRSSPGTAGSTNGDYFKVVGIDEGGDALECNPCDGDGGNTDTDAVVFVAMCYLARRTSTDGEERAGVSYVFTSDEQRTATLPRTGEDDLEQEEVRVPSYQPGDVIFAAKPGRPTGVFHIDEEAEPKPTSTPIVWQETCERGWGRIGGQP